MNKRKVYYLVDSNDFVESKFVLEREEIIRGNLYTAICNHLDEPFDKQVDEWAFFAELRIKWDGCSSWGFYGADYCLGDNDSSYHLCGFYCYEIFFRAMCFAWKIAEDYYKEMMIKKHGEKYGKEMVEESFSQPLCDEVLKGYTIKYVFEDLEEK